MKNKHKSIERNIMSNETKNLLADIYVQGEGIKPNTFVRNNLRKLRNKHNLTQDQLSSDTGLHQSLIYRIENGKANLTCENMILLARYFKCSLSDLLDVELPDSNDDAKKKLDEIKAIISRQ